jgi:hypothetical protein
MDSLADYIGLLSSLSYCCPALDLRMDSAQADPGYFVHLPTVLPMGAPPSLLPPGIIGDPLLGVSGVQVIVQEFYCYPAPQFMACWLQEPLMVTWLTAVPGDPCSSLFAINTSAYADLVWTVSMEHCPMLRGATGFTLKSPSSLLLSLSV